MQRRGDRAVTVEIQRPRVSCWGQRIVESPRAILDLHTLDVVRTAEDRSFVYALYEDGMTRRIKLEKLSARRRKRAEVLWHSP